MQLKSLHSKSSGSRLKPQSSLKVVKKARQKKMTFIADKKQWKLLIAIENLFRSKSEPAKGNKATFTGSKL